MTEPQSDGGPKLPAVLAFFGPLALYAFTAACTVQGGDAAEFGLIGLMGGVPHPPGYPVYAVIARLFGLLPINPPFLRISLASALCGAAAVFVVQRVGWRLTRNPWAAFGAAMAFALAPLHWRLSGIPEVFSLHALLVALAMLFTIRLVTAAKEERPREAIALGLIAGLGLANHLTMVLAAPLFLGSLVHVFKNDGRQAGLRVLGLMTAATLVGLLPYFLLVPWAHADAEKALIWGKTGTLRGLIHHVLRREYGTFSLHADKRLESVFGTAYIVRAMKALVEGYAYLFFLAGLVGVAVVVRARKAAGIVLLLCLFLAGVVFPSLITFPENYVTIEVAERFFIMPLVLFAPFVAWGLAAAFQRYASLRFVLPVALVLGGAAGWHQASWRRDTILHQYVSAIVQNVPPNAVIIGQGDSLLTAMEWRRIVLGVRPDVQYVDPFTLRGSWYYERVRRALPEVPLPYDAQEPHAADLGMLIAKYRPTFYAPWLLNEVKGKVVVIPWGLLFRVGVPGMKPPLLPLQRDRLEKDTAALGGPLPEPADAWSREMIRGVLTPWSLLSETYSTAGQTAEADAVTRRITEILPPRLLETWTGDR
jgi:lipoprotein signal peptidase